MKINRNVWSGSNHDTTYNEIEYGDSILTMLNNKTIFLNADYDHTIAPWGIPAQQIGAYRFFDGKPQCVGKIQSNEICFYRYPTTSNSYTGIHTVFNNEFYTPGTNFVSKCLTCWSPEQSIKSSIGYLKPYGAMPIYDFLYNEFMGVVSVECAKINSDGETIDIQTTWFSDYFNNVNNIKTTHPYLLSMRFAFKYKKQICRCSTMGLCMGNATGEWDKSKLNENYGDVLVQNTIGTPIYASSGVVNSDIFQIIGMISEQSEEPATNFNLYYGHAVGNCNASNIRYIKRDDLVTKWVYSTSNPESFVHKVYPLYEISKEKAIEIINSYGIIWSENSTTDIDSQYTHFPSFVNGIATTGSTTGIDNKTNPGYNWKNPWNESGYNPDRERDNNKYTDTIDLVTPTLTTTGIFNRTFTLTSTDVNQLSNYLWNADDSVFKQIVDGLLLMGGNPIDGIIDLRLYPFNVVTKSQNSGIEDIVIGRTNTSIKGVKITNYNAVLDLGRCTFYPYFGNFLDYEPFTTASLYIPYVGIVPISTADFMGQTISCKMVVDITTGSCTAIVFANKIPIIYKNGNIGVEIPMTGTNSAEYASRIMGGLTSGVTDVALGAASKSVGQVVSGVGSIVDSALSVNNTMYNTAGSSSPACGLWQPQNCYFIIQRPVPIVPENYGHTVGYACNYQAKISDCSGYTQTYNVDVSSINAPESEKNAIAGILNNGFYA